MRWLVMMSRMILERGVYQSSSSYVRPTPGKGICFHFFSCLVRHADETLLKTTAKSTGVSLTVKLAQCKGCMLEKGIRTPIAKQTSNRSKPKVGRVFVELSGEKEFPAPGGKRGAIGSGMSTRVTCGFAFRAE